MSDSVGIVEFSIEVSDDENTARALFHPFHLKNGHIKREAFKPPVGRKDLSVNRLRIIDLSQCKLRAIGMQSENKRFEGFARLSVGVVRDNELDVVDSREYYLGHGDIIHNTILERGVPAPPEYNALLTILAKQAEFLSDPFPGSSLWSDD
jgi:hypothetical protein